MENKFKKNLKIVLENRLKIANKRKETDKNIHWGNEAYFLEDMLCLIDTIVED